MLRFTVIVLLVSFLGWVCENIFTPWCGEKLLRWRIQQALERQKAAPPFEQCVCEWFDHDTLIRNPHCTATDHGGIQKILNRIERFNSTYGRDRTQPYKMKYRKE